MRLGNALKQAKLDAGADMKDLLQTIHLDLRRQLGKGDVASYIPELAGVDPRKFGIAVRTVSGESFATGDADEPFSIQSISKVFALTMALGELGDALWRHSRHRARACVDRGVVARPKQARQLARRLAGAQGARAAQRMVDLLESVGFCCITLICSR